MNDERLNVLGPAPDPRQNAGVKIVDVASWDEFSGELQTLNSVREKYVSDTSIKVSEFLYRGQQDSSWGLETTLERATTNEITLNRYYRFVYVIKAKIESVTGKSWDVRTQDDFEKWLQEEDIRPFSIFPEHAYLAYLRHHGLPSPLLDWSYSPYIAAYFAMVDKPHKVVDSVAVHAYLETPKGIKISNYHGPSIQTLGPYVKTHKRHYLQQSTYTICTARNGSGMSYANHERVVAQGKDGQDLMWKFVIPVGERLSFLSKLEQMNINSYSLFETDDKLMEQIDISEIQLRDRL